MAPGLAHFRSGILAVILVASAVSCGSALATTTIISPGRYSADMEGLNVSFLARDMEAGTDHVFYGSDLDTRLPPFSTFKIPNLLIAMETGVAQSLEAWRDWDPAGRNAQAHWPEVWKEGQTLESAFARSTVWYFQVEEF